MVSKKKDGASTGPIASPYGDMTQEEIQQFLKSRQVTKSGPTSLRANPDQRQKVETIDQWKARTKFVSQAQQKEQARQQEIVRQQQAEAQAQQLAQQQAAAQAQAQAQQQAIAQQQQQANSVLGSTPNPVAQALPGANDQTGAPAQDASLQRYQDEQLNLIRQQVANQQASYQKLFDALNAQAEQAKQMQLMQQGQYDAAQKVQAEGAARAATQNLNSETRFGDQQKELARQLQNQTVKATRATGVQQKRKKLLGGNFNANETNVTRR